MFARSYEQTSTANGSAHSNNSNRGSQASAAAFPDCNFDTYLHKTGSTAGKWQAVTVDTGGLLGLRNIPGWVELPYTLNKDVLEDMANARTAASSEVGSCSLRPSSISP